MNDRLVAAFHPKLPLGWRLISTQHKRCLIAYFCHIQFHAFLTSKAIGVLRDRASRAIAALFVALVLAVVIGLLFAMWKVHLSR